MKPHRATPRRYLETLRQLEAEQIWHQMRRRLRTPWQRRASLQAPSDLCLPATWGTAVSRCRPALDRAVLAGRFRFWGTERQLDPRRPWLAGDLGPSWNYPVHYFDALPGLVDQSQEEPDLVPRILDWLEAWLQAHPPGTPVAWDPYPTALRLVNWIDALQGLQGHLSAEQLQTLLGSLYVQAGSLEERLERHLLGTHLLKDVKALLVTASLFRGSGSPPWKTNAQALLLRELRAHVHADGSHAEPSAMYHCTALEDVLDLLNFRGVLEPSAFQEVQSIACRMAGYARFLQTPSGEYPLLGDAWPGGAPTPEALGGYARRLGLEVETTASPVLGMRLSPDAGVAVWRDARLFVVADVGGVGPPHLSGHGHCDSLSFEVWCHALPLIVDSGTFTYEAGEPRHACRATAAHNTVEIDGREQHEIWASFRVARRSTVRVAAVGEHFLEVVLVPWFEPRIQVQRRFEFAPGELHLVDRVVGPGSHRITSRIHLHPQCQVESVSGGTVLLRRGSYRVEVHWSGVFEVALSAVRRPRHVTPEESQSAYAVPWGTLQPNGLLQLDLQGELPCRSTLTLRLLDGV